MAPTNNKTSTTRSSRRLSERKRQKENEKQQQQVEDNEKQQNEKQQNENPVTPNTSTASTQPQKPSSSSQQFSQSSTIRNPYKKTVTKPTTDSRIDGVLVDKFDCLLNSKPHLLPLVQTTTVKGTVLFSAPVSHEPFSIRSILQTIHNNPSLKAYGDVDIGNLTSRSKPYERERIRMETAFFAALASCPESKALADIITDPEFPQRKLRRFYILCRSPSTPGKKDLVNWALLLFSTGFYMKKSGVSHMDLIKDPQTFANAQYEPTTVQTKFKTLFAVFSEHDVRYSFLKDFNNQGTSERFECLLLVLVMQLLTIIY